MKNWPWTLASIISYLLMNSVSFFYRFLVKFNAAFVHIFRKIRGRHAVRKTSDRGLWRWLSLQGGRRGMPWQGGSAKEYSAQGKKVFPSSSQNTNNYSSLLDSRLEGYMEESLSSPLILTMMTSICYLFFSSFCSLFARQKRFDKSVFSS
jgi:hypothetical protein